MKKIYVVTACSFLSIATLIAQPQVTVPKVPLMRQLFHDNIDNSQKNILKLDGKADSLFQPSKNDETNLTITQSVIQKVDELQVLIEIDTTIDGNNKIKWLRSTNDILTAFISQYKTKLIKGDMLPDLIASYKDAMLLEQKGKSIKPIIDRNAIEIGETIVQNFAFKNNVGLQAAKESIILKTCYRYPNKVMSILSKYPNVYFADSIIKSIAYKDPEQLYNYAAAPDALGTRILSSNDPLIKKISLMSRMKSGQMYFPFLDNIYKGKISMDSITKILNKPNDYYSLLVYTEIDYAGRKLNADTPLCNKVLTARLKSKGMEYYISNVNGLHEEKLDKVRFASVDNLTPQEMYYLCVLNEEETYTSSYLGIYKRMFEKMKTPNSDTLLKWMNYDFYKKFVKIAANYNTLDDFLKKMDKNSAEKLMKNFVNGLEKTSTLEDAVDVAESYGSIYNPAIRKLVLNQINENLLQSEKDNNKRGKTIYGLLNVIFLSMDSSNKIDIAGRLGIDGIYEMPIAKLKDTAGRIVIEQFFYGDKDGQGIFKSFQTYYRNGNWKIIDSPEWIEIRSLKGNKVSIFCNKPLETEADLDKKAQENLGLYLEANELYPTVTIHRGHSYYLNNTIEQLPSTSKVIVLGSCGGYQHLSDVLYNCSGAHIISSKQVGTGVVNVVLIKEITETIRLNKNLNWPQIWKNIQANFKPEMQEKFDDYVPPYKNLGAIFITAYQNTMDRE